MRNLRTRSNSRKGATLVEFALTMILFLVLTLAGLEIGRAIWTYSTVSHATKQAVRYAMIHGADNTGTDSNGNALSQSDVDDSIEDIVKDNAIGLNPNALSITTTWSPNNTPGSTVGVRVVYPFDFLFGPLTPSINGVGVKTEYKMIVTN